MNKYVKDSLNRILRAIYPKIVKIFSRAKPFPGTEAYWIQRYASGGNSGAGSYDKLAEFKAEIINGFVDSHNILSVIEFGCGDGNQLRLSNYPSYIGFDVSPKAIAICNDIFQSDKTKHFKLVSEYSGEIAQLTLSLDVIYHLVEDEVYNSYMDRLFNSSKEFVIIYSSNYEAAQDCHEKRRQFDKWVEANASAWKLIRHIPNKFPYDANTRQGSLADFYIYAKVI